MFLTSSEEEEGKRTRNSSQRNVSLGIDWVLDDVIHACGCELDEPQFPTLPILHQMSWWKVRHRACGALAYGHFR